MNKTNNLILRTLAGVRAIARAMKFQNVRFVHFVAVPFRLLSKSAKSTLQTVEPQNVQWCSDFPTPKTVLKRGWHVNISSLGVGSGDCALILTELAGLEMLFCGSSL